MVICRRRKLCTEPIVYIVDDDPTIRDVLEVIFTSENIPVKLYSCAEEFLLDFSRDNAGCILLDIMLPGMNGVELHKVIAALGNTAPVIFITGTAEVSIAVERLKAGAIDFITKPFDRASVLSTVKGALQIDAAARENRLQHREVIDRFQRLTPREIEVMQEVVRGLPNKSIARNLGISSRTVEVHRKNLMEKTKAKSSADLIVMWIDMKQELPLLARSG
jgi:FixJ family two-component response regulator